MIETKDAYNEWAQTYDQVINPTRDMESKAIREVLSGVKVKHILEIGCGTGKNTEWLADRCDHLTAVDFSKEMLKVALEKNRNNKVTFKQADITQPWGFEKADLICCSLVLEHIKDIFFIFSQAASCLNPKGSFYICELHPFKQLSGSRAKFEKDGSLVQLDYYIHHITDFHSSAIQNGFFSEEIMEWFDDAERQQPRLVSFLFSKKQNI